VRLILQDISAEIPISKPLRLGKGDKPRPLRITASNMNDARKVLKEAVKLRQSKDYDKIYINRDMTPLERTTWRKLVAEKREKNRQAAAEGKEENWVIRSGKVVAKKEPKQPEVP
jgi:hypothetical protein